MRLLFDDKFSRDLGRWVVKLSREGGGDASGGRIANVGNWSNILKRGQTFKRRRRIIDNKAESLLLPCVRLERQLPPRQQKMLVLGLLHKKWNGNTVRLSCSTSAIELRGSTVVAASSPLLVEEPPPPHARTTVTLFFPFLATHVIRLLLVLIQTQGYSFTLVYRLLQSCLSTDRYSFLCTVLSLGWCNEFKKTIKDLKWPVLPSVALFPSIPC